MWNLVRIGCGLPQTLSVPLSPLAGSLIVPPLLCLTHQLSCFFSFCLFILTCPNPTCDLQVSDNDIIFIHLSQSRTPCLEWTHGFLDIMVQGMGWGRRGNDMEQEGVKQEDQCVFIVNLKTCSPFIGDGSCCFHLSFFDLYEQC